jgi:hypothetical protein
MIGNDVRSQLLISHCDSGTVLSMPGATAGPRCSWTFEHHSCEHVTKAFAAKAFERPSRLMT